MYYRENPNYQARLDLWDFFMTSYKGGDAYIGAGLLHRHRFESVGDYRRRVKRGYYLNYVRPIVDTYTKYICGAPLSRVATTSDKARFEEFSKNCDGKKSPLSSFIARVCTLSSIYGKQGVLVDGSAQIEQAPPMPTRLWDQGFFPRLRLIKPTQLIDWSLNGDGTFAWILFTYLVDISENPNIPRSVQKRYELWTPTMMTVFKEAEKNGTTLAIIPGAQQNQKVLLPIREFAHNLGTVPYCEFYHTDTDDDGIPESMIEDLAIINRTIFNKCSLLDQIEYEQAFSQLVLAVDEGEIKEQVIGTSKVFTVPKDSPYLPTFISPDASQATLIRDSIKTSIEEMYRIAVLRKGGAATTDQYSTAYGKAVDFEDTEAALTAKAALMESCEVSLSQMVQAWYSKPDMLWIPSYPKAFEVRSFTQEIEDALQLDGLGMGETFMAEARKRIARRSLPQADSDLMEKIDKEIEEIKMGVPEIDPHFETSSANGNNPVVKPKKGNVNGLSA